ncbi:transmembrane protein, putative [Medicago truncatula]|uniref:Transmembrane protein, putative n=1 Tax=Medicago truncatula TaxID=3880 RepID=A0A072UIH3_MEDTR|nr:transmembrane protein, putative [Medicago truncatula]
MARDNVDSRYVSFIVFGTCGMSVAIALVVTLTTFNSKGYSELFPSELSQIFNNSRRTNPFRL